MKIRILPMEPFSDLYFKTCFYNSFFPVVKYFGQSITPFLFNDLITYNEFDTNILKVEPIFEPIMEWNHLLAINGLIVRAEYSVDNLVEEITQALLSGHPVVLWVDSIFLPYRKDTFLQKHLPHTILIFGVDYANRIFHIIDHEHKEMLLYDQKIISFDDVVAAYEEITQKFALNQPAYLEFMEAEDSSKPNIFEDFCRERYLRVLSERIDPIQRSMSLLKQTVDTMYDLLRKPELTAHHPKLVEELNQLVNAKKAELYRYSLMPDMLKEVITLLESLIQDWMYTRKIIVKFSLSNVYKEESILTAWQRWQAGVEKEETIYAILVNERLKNGSEISMTENEISIKVHTIVRDILESDDIVEIDGDQELLGKGMHSITAIKIAVAVEEAFDVLFDDEELEIQTFSTINKIIKNIITKKQLN